MRIYNLLGKFDIDLIGHQYSGAHLIYFSLKKKDALGLILKALNEALVSASHVTVRYGEQYGIYYCLHVSSWEEKSIAEKFNESLSNSGKN